ncbi:MAG: protein RarD [Spirochaeta sp.]|nr:protein RarD [Spirochaeta sp.]RPG12793.1 MAG: EamA family transporter RarD [Proteobacteria bacterium TMED72]
MSRAIMAGVGAYLIWGGSPIYWNAIKHVPPAEALSWRVLWAIVILLGVLALRSQWTVLFRVLTTPRTLLISIGAGLLLSVNWAVFVWAVTSGHIVEVSLGYYINPLMSVALGVVILRETLSSGARLSVAIATIAVVVMTLAGDEWPWIALSLASTFALYGLLKKQPAAGPPLESLLVEATTALIPLSFYLFYLVYGGQSVVMASDDHPLLIPASGLITVLPLVLFGVAVRSVPLSTLGMLQYLAPTIQLVLGLVLYGEVATSAEIFGFVSVWVALAIYAFDSLRQPTGAAEG